MLLKQLLWFIPSDAWHSSNMGSNHLHNEQSESMTIVMRYMSFAQHHWVKAAHWHVDPDPHA